MASKIYRSSLEVRGYELDSFGHVNHAVYISYLEHARWKLLAEEGITLQKFNEWKRWPVIAKIEAEYLKPTFLGDVLEVQSRVLAPGKTHFTVEQTILREGAAVFRGKVLVVTVNERGRPSAMPEEVAKTWGDSE